MQTKEGTRATEAALEAAERVYGRISRARDDLNKLESRGVYAEGYIEEQCAAQAEDVRRSVERYLAEAETTLTSGRKRLEDKIERIKARASEAEIAAANSAVGMLIGDPKDPKEVLLVYEKLFDNPADRSVLEALIDRLVRLLPEGPERQYAQARFDDLEKRLEPRLGDEERNARAALREIAEVAEYLTDARNVVDGAVVGVMNPREKPNLTAYAKVVRFEKENAGRVLADQALGKGAPVAASLG